MGTLQLEKLYLRQCIVNNIHSIEVTDTKEEPVVNYKLQINHHALAEEKREVILSIVAEYKQADKLIANIQVQQAGVFTVKDYTPEQLEAILQGYCVNLIFPHLHARVAELTQQAGLKPLLLPIMDFTLIYQQSKLQAQEKKKAEAAASSTQTTTSSLNP